MAITQVISALPTPPKVGVDAEAVFVQKGEALFDAIHDTLQPQINTVSTQMNTVASEVQADRVVVVDSKNIAATKAAESSSSASLALQYRNEALAAKQSIDGYVVPTEATYSPETIDTKIQNTRLESFLGFNF